MSPLARCTVGGCLGRVCAKYQPPPSTSHKASKWVSASGAQGAGRGDAQCSQACCVRLRQRKQRVRGHVDNSSMVGGCQWRSVPCSGVHEALDRMACVAAA